MPSPKPKASSSTRAPVPAKKAPAKKAAVNSTPWTQEELPLAAKKTVTPRPGLTLKISDNSVPKAKPHIKFPKTLPACADRYAEVMEARLALMKKVEALAEEESSIKAHIINNLPLSEATGVAGLKARVSVVQKARVQVTDWDAIQAYAIRNKNKGGFAVFQRRVNDATIKELLAKDKKFTGAKLEQYKSLSLSRLK